MFEPFFYSKVQAMVGTAEFVAPEVYFLLTKSYQANITNRNIQKMFKVVNYDAITTETDQWSLGVLCFILLSGKMKSCTLVPQNHQSFVSACVFPSNNIWITLNWSGSSPFLDEEEDQQRTLSNVSM